MNRALLAPLALLLGGALPLAAQEATAPRSALANAPFSGLFVDTPDEHGALWARGATYKIGFENGRSTYVPLFGARAPRSYPLSLALRSARCGTDALALERSGAPRAHGARIEFAHGTLLERWDLAPDAAEQSFVLAAAPGSGALVLELALETELDLLRRSRSELVFGRPELGELRYGEAVAIDASGTKTPLELTCTGAAIEIHVPAALLASARYPLIVDPILRTFAIDTSAADTTEPDAAYHASADVWLVVCRERISGGDGDIQCRRFSGDGRTLLDVVYAESSTSDASLPAVASCAAFDRFLVAWVQAPSPSTGGAPRINVRERHASSSTQELLRNAHLGQITTVIDSLDLGGSSAGSNRFQLLWHEQHITQPGSPGYFSLALAGIWSVGATSGSVRLLSSTASCDTTPRISKDSGPHERWIATWTDARSGACGDEEVRFALLAPSGALVQGDTPLATPLSGANLRPAAAGDGERFFLVWQRANSVGSSAGDILGVRIVPVGSAWGQSGLPNVLGLLEPGVDVNADQTGPSIGFDGCRYVYAYSESSGGGVPRPFAATFLDRGTNLLFHEGHLALSSAASGVAHSSVKIATQGSGGGEPGAALAVWQQIGNGGRDLGGTIVDVRATNGGISTLDTGCPDRLLRTSLDTNDVPALGRSFSLSMTNVQGAPLLLLGLPSAPLPLCRTLTGTCSLGVALPALAVLPAGSATVRIPCDALLVGGTLAAQGIDLGAGSGCPTALFGVPFRTTETLIITVQ